MKRYVVSFECTFIKGVVTTAETKEEATAKAFLETMNWDCAFQHVFTCEYEKTDPEIEARKKYTFLD